jgi:hypothetical protein
MNEYPMWCVSLSITKWRATSSSSTLHVLDFELCSDLLPRLGHDCSCYQIISNLILINHPIVQLLVA